VSLMKRYLQNQLDQEALKMEANRMSSADFPTYRVTHNYPSSIGGNSTVRESVIDWSMGQKFDQEKPRMDLLDPEFLEDVARVLTFGAAKYGTNNWRSGIAVSRLVAAAYRHLGAINRGEDIDPESGLPHSAHLGCCVQFLTWTLKHKPELDDRWKDVPADLIA